MLNGLVSPWLGAIGIFLCAAAVCAAILRGLLATGLAWRLATDVPNDRSLHVRPTPRVGGWGVVPVSVAAMMLFTPELWVIALLTLGLATMSQVDDRRGLSARVRFAGHLLAVAILMLAYPALAPWWWLTLVAFLMLWLINLYNFMDGADGLAGGMTLFGFGAYSAAAFLAPNSSPGLALASAAIAGAAGGFLWLNFHPAKLFLGDAGSISVGFLAGAFGYWGWRTGAWPIWFPAMVFAPFICDASVTLLRRLLRGEKFWQAHREHYYQRVIRSGVGHARMAECAYVIMCAGIAAALWALGRSTCKQWAVFCLWYGVLAIVGAAIDLRWHHVSAAKTK
ncbi:MULTISPECIES: MraY family glycosyltransferase [Burkholderia]|uniref:MraY family glycosyltransferase n=1 Tax=Burkholderia TaxID=32008 RepID=UPI00075BAD47|nr:MULTISPECIES: glycosyltransferase family 4 protein [Burkholderia]AOJ67935.1 glycosyl transferase [Burkholderia savannae]KVG46509.1 glycosyl transferase [Burkholderia sp. MSMB0265]KVG88965.1 glycosyl transferase [Burkholderia sp. MSMB2040]KVG93138.1 glycosyl transferase [Burkholderia sp. MSMB2042]KVH02274.1 glycosyl transferase [Burkholderia sp. MSMB2041]